MSFEIDGYEFTVEPLKVEAQLRGMTLLAPVIFALKAGKDDPAQLLSSLTGIEELRRMFAAATKVSHSDIGNGAAVPLAKFENLVFQRAPLRMLKWLGECVKLEYADFLAGNGLAIKTQQAGAS